jgi:hypothetical protein
MVRKFLSGQGHAREFAGAGQAAGRRKLDWSAAATGQRRNPLPRANPGRQQAGEMPDAPTPPFCLPPPDAPEYAPSGPPHPPRALSNPGFAARDLESA